MTNIPRFLKPSAAEAHLGIPLQTLEELIARGDGPKRISKLGSTYYEIRDLNHYLEKQRRACTNALQLTAPDFLEALFDG